jgi:surface antigen
VKMKDRKEMKKLVATLVAVGVLGGCANMNNAQQGQLIGVGLGTIAAHNLSKGHKDRGLALVVGALAGGIIGQQVGAHLDARDREMYGQTMQHTLERAPDNSTGSWNNPNSGHSGTVVPTQTYQASNGQYCREFQTSVVVGGETQQGYGRACRQPDGSWKISQ